MLSTRVWLSECVPTDGPGRVKSRNRKRQRSRQDGVGSGPEKIGVGGTTVAIQLPCDEQEIRA